MLGLGLNLNPFFCPVGHQPVNVSPRRLPPTLTSDPELESEEESELESELVSEELEELSIFTICMLFVTGRVTKKQE